MTSFGGIYRCPWFELVGFELSLFYSVSEHFMKQIYFIRHGETELNRLHIIQGSGIDSSLNDTGRRQAAAFYGAYADINFEMVICSTLRRTLETVAPFLADGLPLRRYGNINEMCWGEHEGKPSTPEMREAYQTMVNDWQSGNFYAKLGDGSESAQELGDRLNGFIEHLKLFPEERILVCSHGRAMRAMMALLKGESLTDMEKYKHHNTGLYLVTYDAQKGFEILKENDISHLNGQA